MYKMTIWNQESTNYSANAFVNANGTDTIKFESLEEMMHLMGHLVGNPQIEKVVVECHIGCLTWIQCYSDYPDTEEALDDCFDDSDDELFS